MTVRKIDSLDDIISRKWTLAQAFAYFGAVATNRVWSWSARSPDERTIVLTLWEDRVDRTSGRLIYDTMRHPKLHIWRDKLGNRDRIKNLQLAYGHPDVQVRAVIIKAKDLEARTRSIVSRYPHPRLFLTITQFNPETGEFRAEETNKKEGADTYRPNSI